MSIDSENNTHHNPHGAAGDSPRDPATGIALGVIVNDKGKPYAHKQGAYEKLQNLINSILDRIPHGDRLMILLTAVIALSTVGQMILSCNNNRSTAVQVDRLIDAADRVDDAAESFSRSASGINGGVSDAVAKLGDQAKKMDDARISSEKQSRASLRAAIDNFRQDQRPYLGESVQAASDPQIFHNATGSYQIVWTWRMTNFGKSPANSIEMNQEMSFDGGQTFFPSYGGNGEPAGKAHDVGSGQPPTGSTMNTVFSAPMADSEAEKTIKNLVIAIRVKITYKDLTGKGYESELCYLKKPQSAIGYCNDNYMR